MTLAGGLALTLVAIWSLILTIALLALARQTSLLTTRLEAGGAMPVRDGPVAGSPLPAIVAAALDGNRDVGLILMSASCSPCQTIAAEFDKALSDLPLTVLLAGHTKAADEMAQRLPKKIRLVRDPEASRLASTLSIHSTPFAIRVVDGIVKGKAYVRTAADLRTLLSPRTDRPELGSRMSNGRTPKEELT